MTAIRIDVPDIATSASRYGLSLWRALDRERLEFFDPFRIAAQIAFRASRHNPTNMPAFFQLLQYNNSLLSQATWANAESLTNYVWDAGQKAWSAYTNTIFGLEGETLQDFACRQADIMEAVSNFNEQIEKVKDDFGFHFNTADYKLAGETDAFLMYQILPLRKGVQIRDDLKPMLLVPPYMLGVHSRSSRTRTRATPMPSQTPAFRRTSGSSRTSGRPRRSRR